MLYSDEYQVRIRGKIKSSEFILLHGRINNKGKQEIERNKNDGIGISCKSPEHMWIRDHIFENCRKVEQYYTILYNGEKYLNMRIVNEGLMTTS